MRFRTASGGYYEVDEVNKRIRRLEGDPTTKRATKEWREYVSISDVGGGKLIVWGMGRDEVSDTCTTIGDDGGDPTNRTRTTWTSRVVEVES